MLFFISYEIATGREYAREIRRIVSDLGHDTWMWEFDSTSGGFPGEEIAEQIELCDVLVYLCTGPDQPPRSNGQRYERNLAWGLGRSFAVITLAEELVPLLLRAYTYRIVTEGSFHAQCLELIQSLVIPHSLEEAGPARREEELHDD